jgi:hypothetical protein
VTGRSPDNPLARDQGRNVMSLVTQALKRQTREHLQLAHGISFQIWELLPPPRLKALHGRCSWPLVAVQRARSSRAYARRRPGLPRFRPLCLDDPVSAHTHADLPGPPPPEALLGGRAFSSPLSVLISPGRLCIADRPGRRGARTEAPAAGLSYQFLPD